MSVFQTGDRVILTSHDYGDGRDNPIWGGSQGCVAGTIDMVTRTGTMCVVKWDNRCCNSYRPETLSFVKDQELDPNTSFILRRRNSHGI